jgi:hypothetical protein
MKTNYVLIDFENVQVKSLARLKDDTFHVCVFLGPANSKLPVDLVLAMQSMGPRATYIILETPGKNALDFHIAYYLGIMSKDDPTGFFHVISKDSGFDPLIHHLKGKKIFAARSTAIEEMPCFLLSPLTLPHPTLPTPPITLAPLPPQPVPLQTVPPSLQLVRSATLPEPVQELKVLTPTPQKVVKPVALAGPSEALVKAALGDLIRRKASRPRTVRTLLSTIHATCGKGLSDSQIQSVYQTLVKRGHVKLEGTRVTYNLPSL